jgi:hypothetical protein
LLVAEIGSVNAAPFAGMIQTEPEDSN